jgi:hypothetical protein
VSFDETAPCPHSIV